MVEVTIDYDSLSVCNDNGNAPIMEGSLDIQLPTIWTVEKQSREVE